MINAFYRRLGWPGSNGSFAIQQIRDSKNTHIPGSRPDLGWIWLDRLSKTAGAAGLRWGFCDWGAAKDLGAHLWGVARKRDAWW